MMSARYGQEGPPQVGFQHWMHPPEAIELPRVTRVCRPLNTLRRQLPWGLEEPSARS